METLLIQVAERVMARNDFYTQCLLERNKKGATESMMSWIPSDIAKKGNLVNLKEWPSDGDWTGPWEVVETFTKMSGDKVEQGELDYKHQRKVSDV